LRNGKSYLLAENPTGAVSFRAPNQDEAEKWRDALSLHLAWSGSEDEFFGIPL